MARLAGEQMVLLTENMHATTLTFQAWESANNACLRAAEAGLQRTARWLSGSAATSRADRQASALASRKRSRAAMRLGLGGGSLLETCFDRASPEQRRQLMREEVLAQHEVVALMRRRHASKVIEEFLKGWALARRTKRSEKGTQLVVETKGKGFAGSKRNIWDPAKLPVRTFVRLVRWYGNNIKLRKEARWEECVHALWCLWLINPAVLTALCAIFLIGDLGVPYLVRCIVRIWQRLKGFFLAKAKRRFSDQHDQ